MTNRDRVRKANQRSIAGEVASVVLIAFAILLLLSLITYDPKDLSWNTLGPDHQPSNMIGRAGAHISDFGLQMFGLASFSIPVLLVVIALRVFFNDGAGAPAVKVIGAGLLLAALSGFLALFPDMAFRVLRSSHNGGVVGYIIEGELARVMNTVGAAIVLTAASVLTVMLTMEISLTAAWKSVAGAVRPNKPRPGEAMARPKPGPSGEAIARPNPLRSGSALLAPLMKWWAALAEGRNRRSERQAREKEERRRALARVREERAHSWPGPAADTFGDFKQSPALAEDESTDPPIIVHSASPATMESEGLDLDSGVVRTVSRATPISRATPVGPETVRARDESERIDLTRTQGAQARISQPRLEAQAALRARAARLDQTSASGVTMDPDVAEMVSTASIVRTVPTGAAQLATEKPDRWRAQRAAALAYGLPSIELLETPISHHEQAEDELRDRATILAEKCKEFAVTGHIHRINPGPVVTTFEFKPDPGIKYSRVVSLADDLCLALKAESIRIDRIPGKSTVGIEVPNAHREKIFLREVIESPKFQKSESKLTMALGKTINGEEYVADLIKMPHLLIAGATGAGKSVTLNSIICSILYKASPEEVKFIMVDPKRLELGLYEGIPHLLTPIVTEPKKAANALKWATNEMENRYRELAKFGVRNIDQYNHQVRDITHPTLSADNPEAPKPLPYIVITIDELSDLMVVARGDVETSIARLAQMARAIGIHLVLATQRPSVDVITGVIKANFPSRIAFRVSSKVDSRTIIDSNGAEALLGQGDMLFLPPASSRLVRVHGSFVNEVEVKRIADHSRNQGKPDYNEEVTLSDQEVEPGEEIAADRDELFEEALAIVTDMGRASTSVLQRRLSIGYGRAAKILDLMERGGFIGPTDGAKPRKVLQAAYEFRDRLEQMTQDDSE